MVDLPHYWQRDIIVRGFCCGTAPVLKFVQIDSNSHNSKSLGSTMMVFVGILDFSNGEGGSSVGEEDPSVGEGVSSLDGG